MSRISYRLIFNTIQFVSKRVQYYDILNNKTGTF